MNISKRIVTFLLTVAMLLSMLSTFGIVAQAETISEGVEYVFDEETGVITFSGTGVIPNYKKDEQPWISFRDKITKIVIGNGITSIGENVFTTGEKTPSPKYFYNVTELILPNTVTKIGNSAFQGTGITSISFPDSVTELVRWSFAYCGNLANVSLPEQFTTINYAVFWGDNNIQKLYVPVTVTDVKERAFKNADIDTIYYQGTEEQFKAITIETTTENGKQVDYNDAFRNANVVYNHTHSYTDKYDAAHHWKECVCSDIINYGAHTFDNSDSKCDSCEFKRVAKIGDVNYTSFDDAYKAAEDGDTIELLTDVTMTGEFTATKNVTIDGNNHSIIANHTAFILETSSDCTFKNITLDCNNKAKGVKIASGNVVFDNVKILKPKSDTITVLGTLTFKTYFKGDIYQSLIDARDGVVNAEPGTVFDLARWGSNADPDTCDLKGAVDTEGNPFFCGYSGTSYYVNLNSVLSMDKFTLLKDVEFKNGYTLSSLDLNGKTLSVAKDITIKGPVTNPGKIVITKENATVKTDPAIENLDVTTTAQYCYVVYNNGVYKAQLADLPEVAINDIKNTLTDADPDLTFALNFAIKDIDKLSEEYLKALMERYGSHYVDYVLTIKGLTDENVTFNANGGADGYLAGQYDAWSENWVSVPFEDVTMKNGESLYIMEYAAKLMGKPGLRFTLAEVAEIVQNFDCGVYFTPEFIVANPYAEITLELKVFTEDEAGNKIDDISVAKNEFVFGNAAIVVDGKITQVFKTVSGALEAAKSGEKVILLRDASDKYVIVTPGVTLDLVGNDLTADYVVAFKDSAIIDSLNTRTTADIAEVGVLKVKQNQMSFAANENGLVLPVWDAELGGYVFVNVKMQHQVEDEDITENEFKMLLRPSLAKYFNNLYLADGGADHDIQILAKVSWIDDDGTVIEQIFAYAPENVTSVYKTTNQGLNILISGIKDLNKVTATAIIKSVTTGVQIAGDSITIK